MKKILLTSVPVLCAVVVLSSCKQKQEVVETEKTTQQTEQVQTEEKVERPLKEEVKELKKEEEKAAEIQPTEERVEEKVVTSSIDGEMIFKSKGCQVCHHPEIDTTGPSLKKIAEYYRGKKDKLIAFFRGESDPIVDPAKFTIMKPQIHITKKLSDEELSALSEFILKH